ncbi:MAG: hypothetical protein M1160_02020 [Candidatus Marsarchaeota archaeon]|jgi:hypothetical protein|nr:hypothetical protein [Candidatus Marsarchaeota archaeon]MCL5111638.1 hypothetical protein [Candidatus Marsarchaeota archaeon]
MKQINAEERKLYTAIAEYLESVDSMYGVQLVGEEEALDRKREILRNANTAAKLLKEMADRAELYRRMRGIGCGRSRFVCDVGSSRFEYREEPYQK